MDFNYDKKETYNQEDINALLEQHSNYVSKQKTNELMKKINEKDSIISELHQKQNNLIKNNTLSSLTPKNQKIVSALIDKSEGEGIEAKIENVKKEYPDFFQPTPSTPDPIDIVSKFIDKSVETPKKTLTLKDYEEKGTHSKEELEDFLIKKGIK